MPRKGRAAAPVSESPSISLGLLPQPFRGTRPLLHSDRKMARDSLAERRRRIDVAHYPTVFQLQNNNAIGMPSQHGARPFITG